MRTTAYRLAVSCWRKRRRAKPEADRALEDRQPAQPGPDTVADANALKLIPEEQRRAIVLHYMCDLPVAEVGRAMGPFGTIKARLSRGRRLLAGLFNLEAYRR